MMGCKGNYSLRGDLCQNTKTLYRTLFLHTLRIAHSFSGIPLIEEQYVYMYALSGIGNVPGLSAIFFMDLVTLFMYIQATTGKHESSLSLLEKLSKKYTFSI